MIFFLPSSATLASSPPKALSIVLIFFHILFYSKPNFLTHFRVCLSQPDEEGRKTDLLTWPPSTCSFSSTVHPYKTPLNPSNCHAQVRPNPPPRDSWITTTFLVADSFSPCVTFVSVGPPPRKVLEFPSFRVLKNFLYLSVCGFSELKTVCQWVRRKWRDFNDLGAG